MHSRVKTKDYDSKPSNLSLVCQLLCLREFNLLKLNTQAGFKVLLPQKDTPVHWLVSQAPHTD